MQVSSALMLHPIMGRTNKRIVPFHPFTNAVDHRQSPKRNKQPQFMTATTTATATASTLPMAWDPKAPSALFVGIQTTNGIRFDTFSSDDGVGVNAHETSCLMKVIDCQAEFFMATKQSKKGSLSNLSQEYRKALRNCLAGWNDTTTDQEIEALELLQLTYAVTHLSEIFLLHNNQHVPGALTANMVRYLRLHHMEDIVASEQVDALLQSSMPDQVAGGGLYWKTLQSLVLRGNLDDAWALLSRHSVCQRSFSNHANPAVLDDYHASILKQDREGFTTLRAVLLSAPLPGGRSDANDDGLEDNYNELETTQLLDGVQRNDYQMWDASSLLGFNPHAAVAIHNRWKKEVFAMGPLSGLLRRIPQLISILSIIKGDFSTIVFESWAERMCAELLYIRPDLRGDDLHTRAKRCMNGEPLQDVILSVMQGNAGRVVETLYQVGGSSGAALPATMAALLCKLLSSADPVSFESAAPELETDLLLSAADAIVSSHAPGRADIGIRLAISLLLPHATPKGDHRIEASLAEILSHHKPETDTETTQLLDLVRPLVVKKSVRVMDGCTNLVLSRYQHYADNAVGAVYWLLRGLELEREAYGFEVGSCNRLLLTSCITTAQALLMGLVGEHENVGTTFAHAKDLATSIREDDLDTSAIREVSVLLHVVDLAIAIVQTQGDSIVASHIFSCLIEGIRSDGVVYTLAHPSMHWAFLQLAYVILNNDNTSAPFDVSGMECLLMRLTEIVMATDKEHDDIPKMRLAFAQGLMRAHIAENAKRKIITSPPSSRIQGALSTKLTSFSQADQERIVTKMLDM